MQIPKQKMSTRIAQVLPGKAKSLVAAGLLIAIGAALVINNPAAPSIAAYFMPAQQASIEGGAPQPNSVAGSIAVVLTEPIKKMLTKDAAEPAPDPVILPPAQPTLASLSLYVDSEPAAQGRPQAIASRPVAKWLGGWNADVKADVINTTIKAAAIGATPVFVTYNIPNRDCGSYSAGGVADQSAYAQWIQHIAEGISDRRAIIILEPDAIAGWDCLSNEQQDNRAAMLKNAVHTFQSLPNTYVYVDAGNARWKNAETMAKGLTKAGIQEADGFSLNVSNYITTDESVRFGNQLAEKVGKRYVIDTSRNGKGPTLSSEWCNPRGRALGQAPTVTTGQKYVDAYLWIKTPGESDGTCNGGPNAGVWWQDYADELIRNSNLQ